MADNIAAEIATAPEPPALSATSDVPVVAPPDPPPATPDPAPADPPPAEPDEPPAEPPAEPAEGDPALPDKPPARDRSFGGRLSELTAARRAAEARADKLADLVEKLVERVPEQRQPETKPAEPPPPAADPRPKRDGFDDPDAYDVALVEWSTRQATRVATREFEQRETQKRTEEQQRQQQESRNREATQAQERWNGQVTELKADPQYADFDEVAFDPALMIHENHVPLIAQAGPKVLYWLGQHPEEAARIAKLDPISAGFELGAIRHQVNSARPPVSKAPPPVTPVRGENRAGSKAPDEMSMEEYAASRLPAVQAERRNSMFGNRTN